MFSGGMLQSIKNYTKENRNHLAWGTRVYPWWMHVDIWQNQYHIVKLKNKIKKIKKKHKVILLAQGHSLGVRKGWKEETYIE